MRKYVPILNRPILNAIFREIKARKFKAGNSVQVRNNQRIFPRFRGKTGIVENTTITERNIYINIYIPNLKQYLSIPYNYLKII